MVFGSLGPEPGELPLGVAAGRPLGTIDCLVQGDLAPQMSRQLGHAERLHDRQAGIQIQRQEAGHLVQRASFDHGQEAAVTSDIKGFPRRD